ncbi:MAG: peptidylprolyl isomerase [Microcoleaceae cyanobacterium MO_207.B10]|nr:peptidylprolyl isomerase [Microcoleaceae cyanobacterium MO_207.B10]
MSKSIKITAEDILKQVKFSLKIPEITEGIITRKIITAAVAEAGIEATTEELQKAADAMRAMNKLHGAKETWTWLEKHGLSLDNFEEIVRYTFLSGKLANHLFLNKVEPYFFENQLNYAGAVIYEAVLDDEDLAMELFYAIQEGEMTFYEVTHQYIQEQELRRSGGYRGIVKRRELKPEISAVVFAVQPPQVVKPIVTSKGVNLIFVEEIIQPELTDKLRYQILSELFDGWIKQQIAQVEVVKELNQKVQMA